MATVISNVQVEKPVESETNLTEASYKTSKITPLDSTDYLSNDSFEYSHYSVIYHTLNSVTQLEETKLNWDTRILPFNLQAYFYRFAEWKIEYMDLTLRFSHVVTPQPPLYVGTTKGAWQ